LADTGIASISKGSPFPGDGLRVVLAGPEPEFNKVARAFDDLDPVCIVVAPSAADALKALQSGNTRLLAVDLTLPETEVVSILQAGQEAKVPVAMVVSRRDSPPLRRRVERISVEHALFQRRPRNALIEVIKNIVQYEVRRAPRATLGCAVRLELGEGKVLQAEGVNISSTGMLLAAPRELEPVQQPVHISFNLPGRSHRILATARLKRTHLEGSRLLLGVSFEAISDLDRHQVVAYVLRTLTPPDERIDPLERSRKATRSSSLSMTRLRALVMLPSSKRRDYFRIRDISGTGAFLYPKASFENRIKVGTRLQIRVAFRGGSVNLQARVHRLVIGHSLEAKLFPNGFAVEFDPPGIVETDLDRIIRG
jgi:PilZ domain-containing protein